MADKLDEIIADTYVDDGDRQTASHYGLDLDDEASVREYLAGALEEQLSGNSHSGNMLTALCGVLVIQKLMKVSKS